MYTMFENIPRNFSSDMPRTLFLRTEVAGSMVVGLDI